VIDRMTALLLARWFNRVPCHQTPVWDWHSPEGVAFLEYVELLVDQGVDINEIGSLIGIRNFSHRYRILRRGKGAEATAGDTGSEPSTIRLQGSVPPLWTGTEGEGRAAPAGRDQTVSRLQEES
jgi:hypothetical protein